MFLALCLSLLDYDITIVQAIGGADICEPPPGEYDNPEDDNSSGSQNNSRLNNINVNNRNEKAHKKPSDGNSGFAKSET